MEIRNINMHSHAEIISFLHVYRDAIQEDEYSGNMLLEGDEWQEYPAEYWQEKGTFNNYILLLDTGSIIGYIKIQGIKPKQKRIQHNYSLGPMYIHPSCRGKGYGKQLLSFAIKKVFQESGLELINISLSVNIENISAQKLYKSCGFEKIGIEKNYLFVNGKYIDVIQMQRIITKNDFV